MSDRAPQDAALAMTFLEVIARAMATGYEKGWVTGSQEAGWWAGLHRMKKLNWLKAARAGLETAKTTTDDPAVLKWIDERIAEYPFR